MFTTNNHINLLDLAWLQQNQDHTEMLKTTVDDVVYMLLSRCIELVVFWFILVI